ncbi:hypothetical protein [Endozoicomonas atrinae]|uniref:hypothetical protein n=1 Tax=Endozoicomonas atrinae TaxID=1333660 RepID=UPI003B002D75
MDGTITKQTVADVSKQTLIHVSTQTDSVVYAAEDSGTLGHHKVRIAEGAVNFTGNVLDGKEIQIEAHQNRIAVKILPGLMGKCGDSGEGNNKSFGISFHSSSSNQEPVYEAEENGSVTLSWESDPAGLILSECSPALRNVSTLRHISEDSGFSNQVMPGMVGSERSTQRECSDVSDSFDDDQVSSGLTVNTEADSDSALTGKTVSLGRQSLSSMGSANSSSASGSVSQSQFMNGQKICAVAEKITNPGQCKETASRMIFDGLITYDPKRLPNWYRDKYQGGRLSTGVVENFMLRTFSKWMGWVDDHGKLMNSFTGFSGGLSTRFVFWLENNISVFERVSQVTQLLANAKRNVGECFSGSIKTIDRVQLYETLSFKKIDKNELKQKTRSGNFKYLTDCSPAIFFYFRELISQVDLARKSDNHRVKKTELLKKIASCTILEKQRGNLDLLNACVNYNMAVQLIEREYGLAGLGQYDSERRVKGELSCNTDYSRFECEDLEIIKHLLFLIEAIEKEVKFILSEYKTCIDALPRALEGKSFEERVLHLCKDESGYTSEPLKGIKSTLRRILTGNEPKNPVDSSA